MAIATMETAAEYREATEILAAAAYRDIQTFWASLDTTDGVAVRVALSGVLPDLVATYGEAVATLAAQRFEIMREIYGPGPGFVAKPAAPAAPERVIASTTAVLAPLFRGAANDPALALQEVQGVAGRFIKEQGRTTIEDNTARDRTALGYRRVLTGDGNCGFCVMVASRDVLYGSEQGARYAKDGKRYHTRCDCVPEAIYQIDRHLDDPDRLALEDRYSSARKLAGPDPKDISYVLRARAQGKSDAEILLYLQNPRPRK